MSRLTRENFTGPWAGLPVAWADDDRLDLEFKPGLYRQTESFLNEDPGAPLLNIHEHYKKVTTCYEKIVSPQT